MSKDKKQLDEFHIGAGDFRAGPMGGEGEVESGITIFDMTDPEAICRLNGYLAQLGEKTYINPYTPINRVRDKLTVIGLNFRCPVLSMNEDAENSFTLPLAQWGGIFDPYEGKFENNANLAIQIEAYKNDGRWTVGAQLVNLDPLREDCDDDKKKDDVNEGLFSRLFRAKDGDYILDVPAVQIDAFFVSDVGKNSPISGESEFKKLVQTNKGIYYGELDIDVYTSVFKNQNELSKVTSRLKQRSIKFKTTRIGKNETVMDITKRRMNESSEKIE